ncbi:MAG TPA: molybdenum cofactor guanylyltransferase [Dehalococcoidales bacterium]|nr:molybdenum cofactor guanylyltransferase [Dehalococcoidales bacterium]
MEISCIILAGGKSLRLGRDKVSERVGNTSLLEQAISCIDSLSKDIIIVTAEERTFAPLADHPKVRIVSDIFPGQGSLGGIYTGLVKSDSFYNLVVAADMPFLNEPLLRYMIEVSDGFDFVLPRVKNLFEPLHAIYSKNCIQPIESMLEQGKKVIVELFNYVKVRYVEAEEVDRFDPRHLSFFNINTKEDLEIAKKIAGGATD